MSGGMPAREPEPFVVMLAPGVFASPVLRGAVTAVGRLADLPADRLSDALLVADALVEQRERALGPVELRIELLAGSKRLTLRIGPLQGAGGERLLAASRITSPAADPLGELPDEVLVLPQSGGAEMLSLRLG